MDDKQPVTAVDVVDAEVMDDTDPVVADKARYTGVVISIHGGFGYIGRVKRGYETIATNGDVFVPHEFPVGTVVEFDELNSDPKRPGKFRTEEVTVVDEAVVLASAGNRAALIRQISERSTYHVTAKRIDPDKAAKAADNEPFGDMAGRIVGNEVSPEAVAMIAEHTLVGMFSSLASHGVSYSVNGDVDVAAEQARIDQAKAKYVQLGMAGQAESLQEEYRKLAGIRQAFAVMRTNNILTIESVIPIKYLADLLVAAPVWFVNSRQTLSDQTQEDDPQADHAVKFFCGQIPNRNFAWLYQIYNRRTRPFSQFAGRDIMPLGVVEILEQAKRSFDYLVIATPYHDIASREWSDPEWLRNIDPFLIGFMQDMPYMFLLGRWSGTGLFPLVLDMVADTIDHLRLNHSKLRNFHSNSYWVRGEVKRSAGENYLGGRLEHDVRGNNILEPFALETVKAFDEGRLFEFLRGEELPVKA